MKESITVLYFYCRRRRRRRWKNIHSGQTQAELGLRVYPFTTPDC